MRRSPLYGEHRLQDWTAGQLVLPENAAIGGCDAGGASFAQQHHLLDAVDRHGLRRAVAAGITQGVLRTDPARPTCAGVVADQGARHADDEGVTHDQR